MGDAARRVELVFEVPWTHPSWVLEDDEVMPEPAAQDEATQTMVSTLRQWRAAEAKTQAVPPSVIFHDTTLRELAAVRPRTLDELGEVKGVGASTLGRYGDAVLAVVKAHQDSQ